MDYPDCPVYIFYGNQTELVLKARDAVLDQWIPRETRNENLTEFFPTQGETLQMGPYLDEIAGEFEMMSFLPEATKCVVFNNPREIFGSAMRGKASRGKKQPAASGVSPLEKIAAWIRGSLPSTGNKLLLLAHEDEGSGREVDEKSPLFRAIQEVGYSQRFKTIQFFKIEEMLIQRKTTPLIATVRELWSNKGGDMKVYNSIIRCLRFLLQSNLNREPSVSGNAALRELVQPRNRQFCLNLAAPLVQKKYRSPVYRTAPLLEAYHALLVVHQALRPQQETLFVPDGRELLETALIRLLNSSPPARKSQ
jgi:hypothetical protein